MGGWGWVGLGGGGRTNIDQGYVGLLWAQYHDLFLWSVLDQLTTGWKSLFRIWYITNHVKFTFR